MFFQSRFDYQGSPARVVFGPSSRLLVGEELVRLGLKRVLVIATPELEGVAGEVAGALGPRAAGSFVGAAMHTPVSVTDATMARLGNIDGLVAVGGGSAIGLAKALALRSGLPTIAVPTNFAGSEATPILGETNGGEKTTLTDPRVRPGTIVYDPSLVSSLPPHLVASSSMNAIAHAVEGLYARDRNPVGSLMAAEGIRAFATAVPRIEADRTDLEAWSMAQYGAWLCGTVLGQVGMALHHKLCHVLGGTFDLPHAETHAVVLPHAIAYNEAAVPELLAPVAEIFGTETAADGLHEFARAIGAPTALEAFGFTEADIPRAVDVALARPYWNPRALTREGLSVLLSGALTGERPARAMFNEGTETVK